MFLLYVLQWNFLTTTCLLFQDIVPYVTSGRESSGGSRLTRLLVLLDLIFVFSRLYPIGFHFRKNQ